jgi:GAF domain-containing protein
MHTMIDSEVTVDEGQRIAALQRYSILDTLPEQIYDDVTAMASLICGTPMSLVSLVDAERQWFKSTVGVEMRETPRSVSFCAHTIPTGRTLIVPDAEQDLRFKDNPVVTGEPHIRFYAGAPIVEADGHVLGTVCVIDTKPRSLSPIQIAALEALARHVMALMEMRYTIAKLTQQN